MTLTNGELITMLLHPTDPAENFSFVHGYAYLGGDTWWVREKKSARGVWGALALDFEGIWWERGHTDGQALRAANLLTWGRIE